METNYIFIIDFLIKLHCCLKIYQAFIMSGDLETRIAYFKIKIQNTVIVTEARSGVFAYTRKKTDNEKDSNCN